MICESISVSRNGVWKECKQKYKYKYHLKLPSLEPEPEYFAYGKIVHKIIELYTTNRGEVDIGTITQDVLTGKVDLEQGKKAPPLTFEYKKKLPDHLRSFMKLTQKIGTEGICEHPFLYDIDPPNGALLKGFIDRIIIKSDEYFILDYKTTKKGSFRKTSQTITADLQLQAYCRIIQKEFNVPAANIKAALFYLDGGELVGAKFSQETLDNVEEKLRKVFWEIRNTDPETVMGTTGWHCKRCEFNKVCPFFKEAYND